MSESSLCDHGYVYGCPECRHPSTHPSREGASHEEETSPAGLSVPSRGDVEVCELQSPVLPHVRIGVPEVSVAVVPSPRPEPAQVREAIIKARNEIVAAVKEIQGGYTTIASDFDLAVAALDIAATKEYALLTTCAAERAAAQQELTLLHAANKDLLQSWDAENEKRHDAEEDLEVARQEIEFYKNNWVDICRLNDAESKLAALESSLTAVAHGADMSQNRAEQIGSFLLKIGVTAALPCLGLAALFQADYPRVSEACTVAMIGGVGVSLCGLLIVIWAME